MIGLDDKQILITGAASGIGRALAELAIEGGCENFSLASRWRMRAAQQRSSVASARPDASTQPCHRGSGARAVSCASSGRSPSGRRREQLAALRRPPARRFPPGSTPSGP